MGCGVGGNAAFGENSTRLPNRAHCKQFPRVVILAPGMSSEQTSALQHFEAMCFFFVSSKKKKIGEGVVLGKQCHLVVEALLHADDASS